MSLPDLPPQNSTNWFGWASAIHAAVKVAITSVNLDQYVAGLISNSGSQTRAALNALLPTTTTPTTPTVVNSVAPSISGTPTVGSALTAVEGTWSVSPDTYGYQWRRAGASIPGATSKTYTLVGADAGTQISVGITAYKSGYSSGYQVSGSVSASAATLSNTAVPVISGTPTVGSTLSATGGTWSATPDAYAYQWLSAGSPVNGATSSTYVVAQADVGQAISVSVSASKAGYSSLGPAVSASVTGQAAATTANYLTTAAGDMLTTQAGDLLVTS